MMSRVDDIFGIRLRRAMDRAGVSDQALAHTIGMRLSTVRGWLRAAPAPGVETLVRICEALDCSADTLLGLDGRRRNGA